MASKIKYLFCLVTLLLLVDVYKRQLCECVGKLSLAKHPFGNEESNIDYALSISKLFPQINHCLLYTSRCV